MASPSFNLPGNSKKDMLDQITPHKVALVTLIQEFCSGMAKSVSSMATDLVAWRFTTEQQEREFLYSLLRLIQEADRDLVDLVKQLQETATPGLLKAFLARLKEIDGNLDSWTSTFQLLNEKLFLEPPAITRSSVIGLFIRRMNLAYDKLSFSQVIKLYNLFHSYYAPLRQESRPPTAPLSEDTCYGDEPMTLQEILGPPASKADQSDSLGLADLKPISKKPLDLLADDIGLADEPMTLQEILGPPTKKAGQPQFDLTESSKDSSEQVSGAYSRRQAEYFISQQAQLLHHNEAAAHPPKILQQKVMDLLKNDPALAEAHFLSYLNHLRINEFVGALESLHHYFDRHCLQTDMLAASTVKAHKEDDSTIKGLRYAALSLTALHYRFGHRTEALMAVKEAIRMAQETNDAVCLQHALGWLYRLEEQDTTVTGHLVERSYNKSVELAIPYLVSLGVQAKGHHFALAASQPARVFESMIKGDINNCQHSQLDLMSVSYAQKAALWNLYGNREMCTLMSTCALHLNTSENNIYHCGESTCICLCNLAVSHAQKGDFIMASDILDHCKQMFPASSQYSKIWILTEQQLAFDQAVNHLKYDVAQQAVTSIASVNEPEAAYRRALLYKEKGDFQQVFELIERLQKRVKEDKMGCFQATFMIKLLLLEGEVYCCTGNPSRACRPCLEAVTLSKKHHLLHQETLAKMQLASAQLQLGMAQQAMSLLQQILVMVLTHGSWYDRGRALFLCAKCIMAARAQEHGSSNGEMMSAVQMLLESLKFFRKVDAHVRVKDVLYHLACLYHQLGYTCERNKSSLEFRQLDQLYPTLTQATVCSV